MKISILSPNVSSNALGRAYILAQMLKKYYEVEIVGPMFGENIWFPLKDEKDIPIKFVRFSNPTRFFVRIEETVNLIDANVVYISKYYFASFGVGLLYRGLNKIPLVLDIDDWDAAWWDKNGFFAKLKKYMDPRALKHPNSPLPTLILEKFTFLPDKITVSSKFLQKRFGGTIIPHARDTDWLNPAYHNKEESKLNMGLSGYRVIMFYGTIREHKGIEDLFSAIATLNKNFILGVLIGVNKEDVYLRRLILERGKYIRFLPLQPFSKLPEILSAADIVVIPQRRTKYAVAQVPAKVFDAMAMAKPIIATNIGDLPEILSGCGWIVEPENPKQLAERIQYVFSHPEEAEEMGRRAREKCVSEYSYHVTEKKLRKLFKHFEPS